MRAANLLPESSSGVFGARLGAILLLLCVLTLRGLAIDMTTTDGRTYKGCTVSQVEPDALRIIHSDGAARIPYEKLPPALQKQYFDPAKVAAYREQAEEAKRAAAAKAEEAKRLAAAKADEDRRQQQIAAAQAEEQREAEAEARQQQEAEQKVAAQSAEEQRLAAEHKKAVVLHRLILVALILSIFVYFLPTIIGWRKANATAIFVFNLFLGWTFLGWVAALIWACTQDSAMDILARQHLNRPPSQPPPPRPYPEHELLADREPIPRRGVIRDREGRYLE